MDNKRLRGALRRLLAAWIMLLPALILNTVNEVMLIGYKPGAAAATMTGDVLSGAALDAAIIGFFGSLICIAAYITQLVGVCKSGRFEKSFKAAICPAVLMMLAYFVIFYLEAADIRSMNPTLSAVARLVSGFSFIVMNLFVFKGFAGLSDNDGEKEASGGKGAMIVVLILGFAALILAVLVSFLGAKTLGVGATKAIAVVRSVLYAAAYVVLIISGFKVYNPLKKQNAG